MWNTPRRVQLDRIPRLYETEHIPVEEKMIYLHFFIGGCDWYVSEYDGDDLFFRFAILNGDNENAELGYISFSKLKPITIEGLDIVRDMNETPTPTRNIGSKGTLISCKGDGQLPLELPAHILTGR